MMQVTRQSAATRAFALILGILLIVLATAPLWAGSFALRLMGEIFLYLALATLWNLLAGYAGLVSVGQQAYVGLGAYAAFGLAMLAGVPVIWALPMAGLIGAGLAVPVALLIFRLRGAYFAIGSWVIAEVFRLSAAQVSALGGGSGTSLPAGLVKEMAASRPAREALSYGLALGLVVLVIGLAFLLLRSRKGLALTAIRDNELAARSLGIDIWATKFQVYVLTAGLTALTGALIGLQKLRISPDSAFSANDWTAFVIFIVVIGGIGTLEGPILGTLIFFALRETMADLGLWYLITLGAVAIVTMLWAPQGLWGLIRARTGWELFPLTRRVIRQE